MERVSAQVCIRPASDFFSSGTVSCVSCGYCSYRVPVPLFQVGFLDDAYFIGHHPQEPQLDGMETAGLPGRGPPCPGHGASCGTERWAMACTASA